MRKTEDEGLAVAVMGARVEAFEVLQERGHERQVG
jgi:hypothetical protein